MSASSSKKRRLLTAEEAFAVLERQLEEEQDDDFDELVTEEEFAQADIILENDNADEEADILVPNKKLLTKKRIVNSIDKCLDPTNFEPITVLPNAPQCTYTANAEPGNKKNVAKIFWTTKPPAITGRQRQCDIITQAAGLRRDIVIDSAKSIFDLFFTPEMVQTVVDYTNVRVAKRAVNVVISDKDSHFGPTDSIEIHALFGLMYFRGLLGLSNHRYTILFAEKTGHPIFSGTMSRNRFSLLHSCLSFDDEGTRPERWLHDRFAAIRDIFETFNSNCSKIVIPSDYLTIDETLYPMRTQIAFKQYNPDKPAKYGMLFKSLNDARFSYTYKSVVYAGKPREEPSVYNITGTENYVMSLVSRTSEDVSL